MKNLALLLAILSVALFSGCRTVAVIPVGTHSSVSHTQYIVPPHAPRHGYRHRHHDYDLEYDTDYGAYLVLGYDGIYFSNDLYFRFSSGSWQTTSRLGGSWHDADHAHVPRKLRGHKRYKRYKKQRRHSPPPHAPAHGYRHRHNHGVDLVFDSGIGAYVVLGFNDLFFFNNQYMRFYDGYWHSADRYDGNNWRRANDRNVPRKLRKARKRNKKGLFKELRHQYKRDHREQREYRERHNDRRHEGKRDKRKRDRRDERDERRDRKQKDQQNDDYDKKERRGNGWLR